MIAPYHSEPTLALLAARGNRNALDSLIVQHYDQVLRFFISRCRDIHLAEDLAQATFLRLCERISGYHEEGSFETWLFRVASNLLTDELRRRRRIPPHTGIDEASLDSPHDRLSLRLSDSSDPAESAETAELIEWTDRALLKLSGPEQEVLALRFDLDLSASQIAARTGVPLGTVLARAHRGLGKLRAAAGN